MIFFLKTTILRYASHVKSVHISCIQFNEFADKYTPISIIVKLLPQNAVPWCQRAIFLHLHQHR